MISIPVRPENRLSIILLGMVFLASLASTIYLIGMDVRYDLTLREKADRMSELIASSSADHLMDYNLSALRTNIEPFFADRDVSLIQITDISGNELIRLSRADKGNYGLSVQKDITKKGVRAGILTLALTDYSTWEKAEKTAQLIITSNADSLWDYNMEALNNSAQSFFRDGDIRSIVIREESGIEMVRLTRSVASSEHLTLKKTFTCRNRTIGSLELVVTNNSQVRARSAKQLRSIIMASITIALVALLTYLFIRMQKNARAGVPDEPETGTHAGGESNWSISASMAEKLDRAIAFIKENYNRNISREGLATMLEVNPDNLGRYFKLYTGEKINEYINRLRIEESTRRLTESDETIVNIAYAVGFENISTFNRAFLKYRNTTPTEFRKSTSGPDQSQE